MVDILEDIKNPQSNDPEKRYYLILINFLDDNENCGQYWELVEGRTPAYETIIDILTDNDDVDVFTSKIVVDSEKITEGIAIIDFMKMCESMHLLETDVLVDEYVEEQSIQQEEIEENLVNGYYGGTVINDDEYDEDYKDDEDGGEDGDEEQ